MKIHIRKIRPEGIEQEESFSSEWVGLTRKDSVRFTAPVAVKADITRAEDEIFVQMTANSQYESFCYRCLEDMEDRWEANFKLSFDVSEQSEFIDISEDVRQELILNLPTRILCQDNCKGLCIGCGVNLNAQTCTCAERKVKQKKVKATS